MGMRDRSACPGPTGLRSASGRVRSDITHAPCSVDPKAPFRSRSRHHHACRSQCLPPRWYPHSTGEHVISFRLDPVEDPRIEHSGVADASGRPRRQHRYAGVGEAVERPIALDLVPHEGLKLRRGPAHPKINIEMPQISLRNVDPFPIEILFDVTQKISQLKRESQG